MRAALVLALVAATSVAVADPKAKNRDNAATKADAKEEAEKPPPPPPPPVDAKVQALMDRVAKGDKVAIDEVTKTPPIDQLSNFMQRMHASTIEERRAVLTQINAQIPDEKGRFVTPKRQTAAEQKAADNLDWLAELQKLDGATPGVGEIIADVVAIRALSTTKDIAAAQHLFDTAFRDETMMYRDEVGRYIRKMEPYCIPALMKESQSRNYDRKRYSNYQLERLDRQEPGKALAAATGDEDLLIAILEVWRKTRYREAVQAVWTKVNADSARTRTKARETWKAYIEGPPPPPAPKAKLNLPGGKTTKEPKPLYLTFRQLADNELRKQSNELLGTDYPIVEPVLDGSDEKPGYRPPKEVKIDLSAVTKQLWDHYDGLRAEAESKQYAEADVKAKTGDLATATMMFDRLLAANPDHSSRAAMANVYLTYARELEKQKKWPEAAAAFSKAHGLAPQGPNAVDALAAHHYTLGMALEAQGKDGGPDIRKAVALKPDYAPAKEAAIRVSGGSRPVWMLYVAFIALLAAGALFALGMLRRRARA